MWYNMRYCLSEASARIDAEGSREGKRKEFVPPRGKMEV